MSWFEVLPVALIAVGWLWAPGLPVAYLLGLRGIAAFAMAPVVSIAVVASTAVVAGMAGLDWSVPLVLVAALAVVGLAGLLRFLLRRTGLLAGTADPRRLSLIAAAGFVPAAVLAAVSVVHAVGSPDTLSQVFDTPFHYNALAYIRDSHDASSLTISALGDPEVTPAFYPAAWHDFTSLVMMSTGASVPVAANVFCTVITVLLWPASCLLLVRQLFGRNTAALVVTGVLSIAFPGFPWDFFGWGVLWPNLLGMALAPALFALVLTVTGWVRDDMVGRGRAWLLLAIAVVAAGFAHPNVLFSLAALSIFPAGAALFLRARRLHREGRTRRAIVEYVVFVVALVGGWLGTITSSALAPARNWASWKSFETPANAVGEVLFNATNQHEALWLLSAVMIVGAFTARRFPAMRWVLAAHLVSGFLYVVSASLVRPDTRLLIGFWYNDSHRLAAMLPITAVPLAVAGVVFLTTRLKALVRTERATVPVLAVGLTVLLVVVTAGLYPADRESRVAVTYQQPENQKLVSDRMRAFYDRVADRIPESSVVIGNPFDGSVMLWALEDRRVLYPHFLSSKSPDEVYLGQNLYKASWDSRVCEAVRRYRIEYVLQGKDDPAIARTTPFQGISKVADARGFELVDRAGPTSLYRITACG
ncbi:DUF6541 family protein [Actinophytocola sp.]|uniref:DUF6541 family protein n=1 Tax=Actinophytocola sp. TaxID=1872138 RepID=UPI002D5086C6|nr:DUF6541 family protein [Actinophytocola sp.]HYQ64650.1 DUF6541 family protein [Actinophytocola sp.]